MKKSDQKMINDAYNIIKEVSPLVNAMNDIAQERKKLLKLIQSVEPFYEPMNELADKVREFHDEKSYRWQESDRGYMINEQASVLESISENLRELTYDIENLKTYIEEGY